MKPATARALELGLRLAAAVLAAGTTPPRHEPRPGCIETRQRADGVWEAVP